MRNRHFAADISSRFCPAAAFARVYADFPYAEAYRHILFPFFSLALSRFAGKCTSIYCLLRRHVLYIVTPVEDHAQKLPAEVLMFTWPLLDLKNDAFTH